MSDRFAADLHLHTNASDGRKPPAEMVRMAKRAGMDVIAVTDHDVVSGVAAAQAEGKNLGITVIPGIELSCGRGEEVHLLVYGIAPGHAGLQGFLQAQMVHRRERIGEMTDKLSSLGMPVALVDEAGAQASFVGRMGLADAMVEKGYVQSAGEAFAKYLNPGRPAFVQRKRVSVAEGVQTMTAFGGVTVLAHPGRMQMDTLTLTSLLPEWQEAGLMGIEAYHASHHEAQARQFDGLAKRMALLVTGGSDCHGRPDGAKIGEHVPIWRNVREDVDLLWRRMGRD